MDDLIKLLNSWWVMFMVHMRPCVSKLTIADEIINIGPCLVYGASIAGDGANADAQIYDGLNTSGEEKVHLEALSGTTFNWQHSHPCVFNRGIYVKVSAATTHVTVTFKPVTLKELEMLRA